MLSPHTLNKIFNAASLGPVEIIDQPTRGIVNHCLIVNETYVIRFDVIGSSLGGCRFRSEEIAYNLLADSPVPVPRVIKLDTTKTLTPHDYLITTKVPGAPISDTWGNLTPQQQNHVAEQAGEYLAHIHSFTFERFGKLRFVQDNGKDFATWFNYVEDFVLRFMNWGQELGIVDAVLQTHLLTVLEKHKPLLDTMTQGALVHHDYHFENILQQDGEITGIIDFEWALSGDPALDFHILETAEAMCLGSREPFLAGYLKHREISPGHDTRRLIYKLLNTLDELVESCADGRITDHARAHEELLALISKLEA